MFQKRESDLLARVKDSSLSKSRDAQLLIVWWSTSNIWCTVV